MVTLLLTILQDAFWSGLAAMGFAILFNVPRNLLPTCALFGALGHAVRTLLVSFGLSIEPATLAAAAFVGFLGTYWAQRLAVPAPIFTVTGAIPMVPGVFAYRAMIGVLSVISVDPTNNSEMLLGATSYGIKTGLILAAIAIGIAFPTLVFQRPKPVV
ncbi:MAG: threonine/serine exporter family protein [Anaerolineae bacterium]